MLLAIEPHIVRNDSPNPVWENVTCECLVMVGRIYINQHQWLWQDGEMILTFDPTKKYRMCSTCYEEHTYQI